MYGSTRRHAPLVDNVICGLQRRKRFDPLPLWAVVEEEGAEGVNSFTVESGHLVREDEVPEEEAVSFGHEVSPGSDCAKGQFKYRAEVDDGPSSHAELF